MSEESSVPSADDLLGDELRNAIQPLLAAGSRVMLTPVRNDRFVEDANNGFARLRDLTKEGMAQLSARHGDKWVIRLRKTADEALRLINVLAYAPVEEVYKPLRTNLRSLLSELGSQQQDLFAQRGLAPIAPTTDLHERGGNDAKEPGSQPGIAEADKTTTDRLQPNTVTQKPSVNVRMIETLQKNPESSAWSFTEWLQHLKCARSTLSETATWQNLKVAHETARVDRMRQETSNRTGRRKSRSSGP